MRRAAMVLPAVAAVWATAERWRIREIPRLPEVAAGLDLTVDAGGAVTDRAPAHTLALLGDSLLSGVGAGRPEDALAAHLARFVAADLGAPIRVRVIARTGARVADVAGTQAPALGGLDSAPDVVLVSAGANDATHLTRPAAHDAALRRAVSAVREQLADVPVVLAGLPDFRGSRALSLPLRRALHAYGTLLHRRQERLAGELGLWFVPRDPVVCDAFARDRALMAGDGFHASGAGAALLAGTAVPAVVGALHAAAPQGRAIGQGSE